MANPEEAGLEVLNRLKSTEPPIWLAPNRSLSQETRTASLQLFSSLKPFCPKSPFDQLLVEGFDAEQIWQQIDLQSQPLLSSLRRELRRLEKKPEEISRLFGDGVILGNERKDLGGREGGKESENEDADGLDGVEMDLDEFDEDEEEDGESDEGEEGGSKEGGFEGEESEDEEKRKEGGGIEDGFLKIKELEEFLLKDEAREYGLGDAGGKKRLNKRPKSVSEEDEDEDDEEEEQEEEEEEDDDEDEEEVELGEFDEEQDDLGNVRYGDFFGAKQKKVTQRKSKWRDEVEEYSTDSEEAEDGVEGNHTLSTHEKELLKLKDKVKQMEKASLELQGEGNHTLSTHEKELLNLKDKIKQMEKANLEPKTWTMQGEVTAAKRPKNSALEVDLDFEQTSRPAPVITEEVTASLEELIRNRVIEGHFDDVEKPPSLPTKGPRELKELDENKSGKGLAEIYEEEYAQKSNLASAPLTFSDELRNEANFLFKKLCLKLDALSHFHFAPKPVIEDMSIQANVPALAMEEIAPLAVSDAAMLAPEEVFAGKGDIKDETELTQADRKRRRAKKKRIYKAKEAKRMAKKARVSAVVESNEGKEE